MASKFNIVAELQLRGPTNLKQTVSNIQKQLAGVNININTNVNTKSLNQANQSLNNVSKSGKQASATINKLGQSSKQAASSVNAVGKSLNEAASGAEAFGKQSALAVKRFTAFTVGAGIIYGLANAMKDGVKEAVAFERQMIKISQVTGTTIGSLKGLQSTIGQLSTSLGASSAELVDVARILSQTGLTARDVAKSMKVLAQSSLAPTFKDMANTAEGAIAIMRQFGVTADQLGAKLGSVNALAGQFAVEAQDLVFAIRRAGGAFQAAGGSLEELLALFTSVRATTRESAETIATGFRTIFTRIQRPKTIQFLRDAGVELQNLQGQFVGPFEAVKRLSTALKNLESTDPRFAQIVEELGGFRQVSKVIPLIQQFGTAQKALRVAMAGQDSIAKDAQTAQLSLAVQIDKTRERFLALFREVAGSKTFQGFAKVALGLANSFINIGESLQPILPMLAAVAAFKIAKGATQFAGGFMQGLGGGGARGTGQGVGGQITGKNTSAAALKQSQALTTNTQAIVKLSTAITGLASTITRMSAASSIGRPKFGPGFATGGIVPGKGNRDTVPAMLTPGEFVIRKSSVEKYGADNIAKMNRGGDVSRPRRLTGGAKGASYASRRNKRFSKRMRGGAGKAYAFDFDDTLAVSDAVVKEGAEDPFEEFRGDKGAKFVRSAKATKIAGMARTRAARGHDIYVVTARPGDRSTRSSINHFMRGIGVTAKDVIGVGGSPGPGDTSQKKAEVLARLKKQYGNITFLDDDDDNVLAASKVPGVKSIKAKKARGGIIQRLASGGIARESSVGAMAADTVNYPGRDAKIDKANLLDAYSAKLSKGHASGKLSKAFPWVGRGMASDKSNAGKLLSKTFKKAFGFSDSKSYQVIADGPGEPESSQLKLGMAKGVGAMLKSASDHVSKTVFGGAKIAGGKGTLELEKGFLGKYDTSSRGILFETLINGFLKGSSALQVESDPNKPFDYTGGLGSSSEVQQVYDKLSGVKYIDAKVSSEAIKSGFTAANAAEGKVMGQLVEENFRTFDRTTKAINSLVARGHTESESIGILAGVGKQKRSLARKQRAKPKGLNTGGGISGSDTVPALLTPGEFVVNKKSAQRIGYGNLSKINQGKINGYATGGKIRKYGGGSKVDPVEEAFWNDTGPEPVFKKPGGDDDALLRPLDELATLADDILSEVMEYNAHGTKQLNAIKENVKATKEAANERRIRQDGTDLLDSPDASTTVETASRKLRDKNFSAESSKDWGRRGETRDTAKPVARRELMSYSRDPARQAQYAPTGMSQSYTSTAPTCPPGERLQPDGSCKKTIRGRAKSAAAAGGRMAVSGGQRAVGMAGGLMGFGSPGGAKGKKGPKKDPMEQMGKLMALSALPGIVNETAKSMGIQNSAFEKLTSATNMAVTAMIAVQSVQTMMPGGSLKGGMRAGKALLTKGIRKTGLAKAGTKPIQGLNLGKRGMSPVQKLGGKLGGRGMLGVKSGMTAAKATSALAGTAMAAAAVAAGFFALGSVIEGFGASMQKEAQAMAEKAETEADVQKAIDKDKAGKTTAATGAGVKYGGMAGAALGMIAGPLGSLIGGAIGAAVGGLIGFLGGWFGLFREDNREINKAINRGRQNRAMEAMDKSLKNIEKQGLSLSGAGSVAASAKKLGGNIGSAVGEEQLKEFRAEAEKSVPAMRGVVDKIAATSDSFEQFQSSFGGAGDDILKEISKISNIPYEELKKEVEEQIEVGAKLRAAKKAEMEAAFAAKDLVGNLNAFRDALAQTSAAMGVLAADMGDLGTLSTGGVVTGAFGGEGIQGDVLGRAGAGQAVNQDVLKSTVDQLTGFDESAGRGGGVSSEMGQIRNEALGAGKLAEQLPSALMAAQRAVASDESGQTRIGPALREALENSGIGPILAEQMSTKLEGMAGQDNESEASIVNQIAGGGASTIASDLFSGSMSQELLDALKGVGEQIIATQEQLNGMLEQRLSMEKQLTNERLTLSDKENQVEDAVAQARGDKKGPSLDTLRKRDEEQQRIKLGEGRGKYDLSRFADTGEAAGEGSISGMGDELRATNDLIAQKKEEMKLMKANNPNLAKAGEEIATLSQRSNQLRGALEHVRDSGQRLAAAQSEAAAEAAKREFKTNLLEGVAFGNADEQQSFVDSMVGAEAIGSYAAGEAGAMSPQQMIQSGAAGEGMVKGGLQLLKDMRSAGFEEDFQGRNIDETIEAATRKQITSQIMDDPEMVEKLGGKEAAQKKVDEMVQFTIQKEAAGSAEEQAIKKVEFEAKRQADAAAELVATQESIISAGDQLIATAIAKAETATVIAIAKLAEKEAKREEEEGKTEKQEAEAADESAQKLEDQGIKTHDDLVQTEKGLSQGQEYREAKKDAEGLGEYQKLFDGISSGEVSADPGKLIQDELGTATAGNAPAFGENVQRILTDYLESSGMDASVIDPEIMQTIVARIQGQSGQGSDWAGGVEDEAAFNDIIKEELQKDIAKKKEARDKAAKIKTDVTAESGEGVAAAIETEESQAALEKDITNVRKATEGEENLKRDNKDLTDVTGRKVTEAEDKISDAQDRQLGAQEEIAAAEQQFEERKNDIDTQTEAASARSELNRAQAKADADAARDAEKPSTQSAQVSPLTGRPPGQGPPQVSPLTGRPPGEDSASTGGMGNFQRLGASMCPDGYEEGPDGSCVAKNTGTTAASADLKGKEHASNQDFLRGIDTSFMNMPELENREAPKHDENFAAGTSTYHQKLGARELTPQETQEVQEGFAGKRDPKRQFHVPEGGDAGMTQDAQSPLASAMKDFVGTGNVLANSLSEFVSTFSGGIEMNVSGMENMNITITGLESLEGVVKAETIQKIQEKLDEVAQKVGVSGRSGTPA